jgi:hypothetical protein
MPIFFIFSLGVFELFLLFIHGLLGAVLLEIFPNFVAYKLALGVLLFLLGKK